VLRCRNNWQSQGTFSYKEYHNAHRFQRKNIQSLSPRSCAAFVLPRKFVLLQEFCTSLIEIRRIIFLGSRAAADRIFLTKNHGRVAQVAHGGADEVTDTYVASRCYRPHHHAEFLNVPPARSKPAAVRPEAGTAMQKIGIDISSQRSKPVSEILAKEVDAVITLCAE
jgi:hypothetical protein